MTGRTSLAPPTLPWLAALLLLVPAVAPGPLSAPEFPRPVTGTSSAVGNFSAAVNRMVTLLGVAGGGILALAWARVALSWFSNDVSKKVQAKDRARDALIGTLIFTAAITGLAWGLAQWIVTGV